MAGEPVVAKAILDRIEDGIAVLLVGEMETELRLRAGELPPGAREGDCFTLERAGERVRLTPDPVETARRLERVRSKLDRLRGG